jgi:hypothetical protein
MAHLVMTFLSGSPHGIVDMIIPHLLRCETFVDLHRLVNIEIMDLLLVLVLASTMISDGGHRHLLSLRGTGSHLQILGADILHLCQMFLLTVAMGLRHHRRLYMIDMTGGLMTAIHHTLDHLGQDLEHHLEQETIMNESLLGNFFSQ